MTSAQHVTTTATIVARPTYRTACVRFSTLPTRSPNFFTGDGAAEFLLAAFLTSMYGSLAMRIDTGYIKRAIAFVAVKISV